MNTHNLPAIAGKTVKSVTTHNNSGGNTEKVRITFTDGTVLTLTTYHRESYIRVRLEPSPPAIVTSLAGTQGGTAQTTPGSTRRGTKWPGE